MGESNTWFSLTYKSLKPGQPSYLRSLLSFISRRCTRSSLITLSRPYLTSGLKIASRSYHSAHVLWNILRMIYLVAHHMHCISLANGTLAAWAGFPILAVGTNWPWHAIKHPINQSINPSIYLSVFGMTKDYPINWTTLFVADINLLLCVLIMSSTRLMLAYL